MYVTEKNVTILYLESDICKRICVCTLVFVQYAVVASRQSTSFHADGLINMPAKSKNAASVDSLPQNTVLKASACRHVFQPIEPRTYSSYHHILQRLRLLYRSYDSIIKAET